jgi:rifampicin phosphotransferase
LDFFFLGYGLPMFAVPQIAQFQIKHLFRKEADSVRDELASLSISLPGNKTAEMGEIMYNLASFEEIKDCSSAEEFNTQLKHEIVSPAFLQRWNQFIEEFGFRCPREIDVATPRPGEQPGLIFNQLKNLSLSINARKDSKTIFEEARLKRETAYQFLYGIALKKGKRKAKALKKYYETIITLGGHRETPKHYVTMVVYLFRKRILKVAQDFVKNDRLDNPDQIFDLTIDDIDKALVDPMLNLRSLAVERTRILNRIKRSHLVARIIDSRGRIYYPPRKDVKSDELVGMSISPGIVQGKVKVLLRADEKKILPGEILVARATDPGWTPLFINAKGIVLEIGPLQHGAIVAREYGIPCVSGIDDITNKLKDGQLVEVDGSNGIVRILEQGPDGKISSIN